jgi:hypothetical protein
MTRRSRNTTAGFQAALRRLADQGNPLAARYYFRMRQAADPDHEAERIRAEVGAILANVARVGRILDDAIRQARKD